MSEAISVFSIIIGLANLVFQVKRSRTEKTRKLAEKFEAELKDFTNNILGWYNQIVDFSLPLIDDLKTENLTKEKWQEYLKLLHNIRASDVYFSKCENFMKSLDCYEGKAGFTSAKMKTSLKNLECSYRQFSKLILYHKDSLGYLLWQWNSTSPSERKDKICQIEDGLKKIKDYKDRLSKAFGTRLD